MPIKKKPAADGRVKPQSPDPAHPRRLSTDEGLSTDERLNLLATEVAEFKAGAAEFKAATAELLEAVNKDRENNEGHRRNLSRALENAFALSLPRAMKEAHGIVIKPKDIRLRVEKHKGGETLEVDFIAPNGKLVLAGEAKTRLTKDDVLKFSGKLAGACGFREMFPEYAGRPLHGVVAGCEIDDDAARLAYKRGFVVLQMTGAEVHPATPVGKDKKIRAPKAY